MSENIQNSFLGDMQTVVRGQVESLTRYEMDGNKGGYVWLSKPTDGTLPNVLGNELMKIKMPFEMFDQKKAEFDAGKLYFPVQMEILCSVAVAAGNKASLTVLSMKIDGTNSGDPILNEALNNSRESIDEEDLGGSRQKPKPGATSTVTGSSQTTTGTTAANKP